MENQTSNLVDIQELADQAGLRFKWARKSIGFSREELVKNKDFIKANGAYSFYKIKAIEGGTFSESEKDKSGKAYKELTRFIRGYSEFFKVDDKVFTDSNAIKEEDFKQLIWDSFRWKDKQTSAIQRPHINSRLTNYDSLQERSLSPITCTPIDCIQEDVIDKSLEKYLKRDAVISEIHDFLKGEEGGCLVIQGEPGSGKTSLSSYLIRNALSDEFHCDHLVYCFISATRRNNNWKLIIADLIEQITGKFPGIGISPPPDGCDEDTVVRIFYEALSRTNRHLKGKNQTLTVVIDGLDELITSPNDLKLKNIFQIIPSDVSRPCLHFVVTTRPGAVLEKFKDHMGINQPNECELASLNIYIL